MAHPQLAHNVAPELNCSPTTTPFQTRAASPTHHNPNHHSGFEADAAIDSMRLFIQNHTTGKVDVSSVDGSATVANSAKSRALALYFIFNLGLTLFNKMAMNKFPYPYLMTAYHALASFVGTSVLKSRGTFTTTHVGGSRVMLYGFSFLYTINIAISNASLAMVTVPYHQVVRATTPVFTILIYRGFFQGTYPNTVYWSLVPVVIGVGLATYGDYYASTAGLLLTILGAFLAALKTVATNRLQTAGLHFSALELLYRMSFLAVPQALAMSWLAGEMNLSKIPWFVSKTMAVDEMMVSTFPSGQVGCFILNGMMAFGLNVVSFTTNKKVGALTMTVAANVKQIMTIVLSQLFWHLDIGVVNATGIALTLTGGAFYAYFSMRKSLKSYAAVKDMEKANE
ncbi:UAA transporter [Xylographa opegraphella]|nr:UAA transporter [Xylographa opegraphella]